ncbi:hypothetical protein GDO78_022647 [Eleutherodactylus coqui]|uniref:Uncharacterized protein n=1 Tax=Eleutherodactylus coqui TaxID=57060 RepID=A0A8J6B2N0_ELECQ|nr:hypothetical protein GDO78_022647 [Eleutherodactylus coqui]
MKSDFITIFPYRVGLPLASMTAVTLLGCFPPISHRSVEGFASIPGGELRILMWGDDGHVGCAQIQRSSSFDSMGLRSGLLAGQ